jgi:phosphatidylserine/phosphatidylglycerophosphate/cardiolipin synthase-like enzyme
MARDTLRSPTRACALALLALVGGGFTGACQGGGDDPVDGENDGFGSGKADGALDPDSAEAHAVLALVNDPAVDADELDDDARLNAKAADGIIDHRNGPDGEPGTADDDRFDDLAELDAVPFVGQTALSQLLAYAIEHGYLQPDTESGTDVIFSPQPFPQSHNARVAGIIDGAQRSLDIAMYSFSDAGINTALANAVARGVKVRFLFETAAADRKLTGAALASSRSGRLEAAGVDVRWVNKIMHHKFMIVDGPRDDAGAATTATLVTGSGNWSNGAATRYDENTLFLDGHRELNLRVQREFDLLWNHSRDLVANPAIVTEHSTLDITDELIGDDAGEEVFFTSANFKIQGANTFVINGSNTVADQLVAAIQGADTSIQVASGHLRSRPVAEALMQKAVDSPEVEIQVYLDGQEFISEATHDNQVDDLEECLANAGASASKIRDCNDSGFLFGFMLGNSGADVRYKYYSYRWSASNALQMHHKFMIIDGDELWTGSYNLSDNAEHNTFENMFHFSGPAAADLVDDFEANFTSMWGTGVADDLLGQLRETITSVATTDVPLLFAPMSLDWQQVTDLKDLLRDECPSINNADFRTRPEAHPFCR